MNSNPFTATLPPPGMPVRSGDSFVNELVALVQDIQRTREWFNSQLDAQLVRLNKLCSPAPQAQETNCNLSVKTLFEAPRPVVPAVPSVSTEGAALVHRPAPAHQAILLAPTLTAALDPELEQATLHELNNALTRAFSEISSRGGMIS